MSNNISYIILEAVPSVPLYVFRHKFCIQIALPISPEIMDRFRCLRCLNDCIKVPDMMRLFAGGTTTPLVVKIWTKQPWVKIEYLCNFDCNFCYLEAKFDYGNFIIFFALWFQDSTQKISSHFDQKWRRDGNFPEFWFYFESEKSTSQLYCSLKWLEIFCVESQKHKAKKI